MKSIFRSTPRSRRARPQQHEAQQEPQGAFFQPKLTINAPGDQYEREADAVADQVVSQQPTERAMMGHGSAVQRMPISRVQRAATPNEEKMPSTNDQRIAEDKETKQEPEQEAGLQKMDAPKEEEKPGAAPIQKMDASEDKDNPVQKAEMPKEEEKPGAAPIQKMDAPEDKEKTVQKAEMPKEEEKPGAAPIQKMDAPEDKDKPVQKADVPEEEKNVQAKSSSGTSQASPNFSARLSARKGTGAPLPTAARAQMEQGIGADFSQVRIHTDSEAVDMNKEIHAQAFTHGQDVYFNNGKFSPESREGKRLLAHELTHVVQQGNAETQNVQRQPALAPPLPAPKTGSKKLSKGEFKWTVKAVNSKKADANLEFIPDKTKVDASAISFIQTVLHKTGSIFSYAGASISDPVGKKSTFSPFEEPTEKRRVDHHPDNENDPFYGAEWDQGSKKWDSEGESFGKPGKTSGTTEEENKSILKDAPFSAQSRAGHGDVTIDFESVPMVIETRESLGALKWGYKIKDDQTTSIELTGAEEKDCTDSPSDSHEKALDKFFEAKFETILDEFVINSHTLTDDHKTKLDSVATKLKADASLKVELGGAADLTGNAAYNQALSLKRANAAKTYLLGKGVTNTITVQSYGFEWARVKTSKGVSEAKNRRVQVRIHK